LTRVLFVSLAEEKVIAECRSLDVGISTIERLPTSGVRLVCMSSDGAAIMRRKLKKQLLDPNQARLPHRPRTSLW